LNFVSNALNLIKLVPTHDDLHASITLSQNGHPFRNVRLLSENTSECIRIGLVTTLLLFM
jgi:hypothetical protein